MSETSVRDAAGEAATKAGSVELVRALGPWDATSLTIGAVIGTGVFLVASDIAKALPHGGMLLLVFLVGGLLSLSGALTFAELGAMYPRAGGIYHYLREGYGPLPGFLYGWACFLVIMSGGIAAIAIGFGEYFGAFWPYSSSTNVLASATIFGWDWRLTGVQVVAVAAILFFTVVNHFGLKQGALLQNLLTIVKSAAIVGVGVVGFAAAAKSSIGLTAPLPPADALAGGGALAAFGVAMIAALWTYDGWYGATFSAGEMRDPGRTLPLGLIGGTAIVMALYLLINLVYLRALPITQIAQESRVGEAAVAALFGVGAGKALAAAVVLSTLGCLAATILYSSRIYQPMAADGLFFPALAKIDPVRRVPLASLWSQSLWAVLLTLSGTYSQLYTFSVFAGLVFHAAAGAAVFVLRRKAPALPRPYRTWGYPVVPLLFLGAMAVLILNTVFERPVESLAGLALVALGIPAYAAFRRGAVR
jgi:APA family basic amino acid/polyamine antiporter